MLGLAEQHVELVVAEHALGAAGLHPAHDEIEDGRAVRAPVAQVAHEYRPASLRMAAVRRVAQVPEQGLQGLDFTVDVADHVQRALEQGRPRTV